MESAPRREWTGRLDRLAGPALIAIAMAAMLSWTWGTWPDPMIDTGRELYVPWQLAAGQVLYRDIAYFNGPLSPYVNATVFRVLGASVLSHELANIVVAICIVALLYSLGTAAAGRLAASVGCLVFVLVFLTSEGGGPVAYVPGDFTFISPYSHEMTHGLALCLAAIYCLVRFQRSGARAVAWIAGCGLALGMAFLTKPEIFAAGAAAVVPGLAAVLWVERPPSRTRVRGLWSFTAGLLGPAAVAWMFLAMAMPARTALLGILGGWKWVLDRRINAMAYYRMGMGTYDVGAQIQTVLIWSGGYAAALGSILLVAWTAQRWLRSPRARWLAAGVCASAIVGAIAVMRGHIDRFSEIAPLQIVMLVAIGFSAVMLWRAARRRGGPAATDADLPWMRQLVVRGVLSVFALAMLAKMILNARTFHYGFVLGLPATFVMTLAAADWVPRAMRRRGWGSSEVILGSVLALWAGFAAMHLHVLSQRLAAKNVQVGSGADAFWTDARGLVVNAAVAAVQAHGRSNTTLSVLPEGATINFLAGMRNSTPYLSAVPVEVDMFGQDAMLASFAAHPPDLLMYVRHDMSNFVPGQHYLGVDYLKALGQWIARNYAPIQIIGDDPFANRGFGMLLMQRRD